MSTSNSNSSSSGRNAGGVPMLERLNGYGLDGLRSPVRGIEVADYLLGFTDPANCNIQAYLPRNNNRVIIDPAATRPATTHNELADFVDSFDLEQYGIGKGTRVALILPNGPELAVCLISIISGWCAAPINASGPTHEIMVIGVKMLSHM